LPRHGHFIRAHQFHGAARQPDGFIDQFSREIRRRLDHRQLQAIAGFKL
jgi:hypothetical protein